MTVRLIRCVHAWCIFESVCNRYSMRQSVLSNNIQARARGQSPEGELPCILHKHEDFSCYNVFYITTTPYLYCV